MAAKTAAQRKAEQRERDKMTEEERLARLLSRRIGLDLYHATDAKLVRTIHNGDSWVDNITWDELMQIKREIGLGDRDAVEIFPADKDIVNVANMRHLWVTASPVMFAWRKK